MYNMHLSGPTAWNCSIQELNFRQDRKNVARKNWAALNEINVKVEIGRYLLDIGFFEILFLGNKKSLYLYLYKSTYILNMSSVSLLKVPITHRSQIL